MSQGLVNWDMFIYYPDQAYPERGFGGSLERLGHGLMCMSDASGQRAELAWASK